MPDLRITPVPFRSSNLAIPTSPFSPKSPLSPPASRPRTASQIGGKRPFRPRAASLPPPPPRPLSWLWQCHVCRQKYPLGATRRCLEDGHAFCSGVTITRSRRAANRMHLKRHRACASQFDYAAWAKFGDWRRAARPELAGRTNPSTQGTPKHCWTACDYPSECRWGPEVAAQGQAAPQPPSAASTRREAGAAAAAAGSAVPPASGTAQQPPATTFEQLLRSANRPSEALHALLAATARRKSSAPATGSATGTAWRRSLLLGPVREEEPDRDGDMAMPDI